MGREGGMIKFFKRLWRKLFPRKGESRVVSLGGSMKLGHRVSDEPKPDLADTVRRSRLKKRQRMCTEMGKRNGQLY